MSVPIIDHRGVPGDVTGGYGSCSTSGYRGCLIGIRECSVRAMISFCTITTMAVDTGIQLVGNIGIMWAGIGSHQSKTANKEFGGSAIGDSSYNTPGLRSAPKTAGPYKSNGSQQAGPEGLTRISIEARTIGGNAT